MATVEASFWNQSLYSTVYMQIDYTASSGSIKINSVKGKASSGGPWNNYTQTHTISFPGGSGSIKTTASTFNSTTWQTWTLSGDTEFSSSGGTGELKWTLSNGYSQISGETFNFGNITIPSPVTTPTLSNVTVSNITSNSASASFTVTNNGGASIVDHYIDANTNSSFPTPQASTISAASGTFTGLSPNTTYYVRANASNGTYRGYSSVGSFTTAVGTPTLSAVSLSNVTSSGANASFTVTSTGGASITTNKIQASEAQSFSYVDESINSTSGTFRSLFPGRLYYIRALASNGTNTGYSAVTTLGTAPSISIRPTSSSDGTIINLGASVVGTVSQWYYSLYDGDGNVLVQDATPGQTISGYTFGNDQITGLTPGVKYGVSLRVTYTQGAVHSTTGTDSGIWYVTTEQPAAISFSTNGAAFSSKPLYVSINGTAYKLITKDKLNIL